MPELTSHAPAALPSPYRRPELYDLLFEDFTADVPFWVGRARSANGPVLEVGCGTGRVLLRMLEAGCDADGFDVEPRMIERLRQAASARGLAPTAWVDDVRSFSAPRRYALVAIPFNAFAHCLEAAEQIAALTRCREALLPDGRLVLDVMHPSLAWDVDDDGRRTLELETRDPASGRRVRFWETRRRDRLAQRMHSVFEAEALDDDGVPGDLGRFATTFRWFQRPEMELLLGLAGFARWEFAGDFDGRPLGEHGVQMIVSAWSAS